jgi:hypothetical protein
MEMRPPCAMLEIISRKANGLPDISRTMSKPSLMPSLFTSETEWCCKSRCHTPYGDALAYRRQVEDYSRAYGDLGKP